jgi:branched-chain amino acid transport system ATP-binding protein
MSYVLETKDLGISFGGLVALADLNIQLEKQEILGIIGPNGAGKTTFLNLISGVYAPTSGELFFKGNMLNGKKPYEIASLGISRTFQNIRLIPYLSVLENVMLGRSLKVKANPFNEVILDKNTKKERKEWIYNARQLIDFVGLTDVIDSDAVDLPYGMQRKVEIARALATDAELILLDEPGAGMNSHEKEELVVFIKDIREKMNKTIIVIEHDMKFIGSLVDRVVVLNFGRPIAEGSVDEVKMDPKVITAYLGEEVCS